MATANLPHTPAPSKAKQIKVGIIATVCTLLIAVIGVMLLTSPAKAASAQQTSIGKLTAAIATSCGNKHLVRLDNTTRQELGGDVVNSATGKVKPFAVAPKSTKMLTVKAKPGETIVVHGPADSTLTSATAPGGCGGFAAKIQTSGCDGLFTTVNQTAKQTFYVQNAVISMTANGSGRPPLELLKLSPKVGTVTQSVSGLTNGDVLSAAAFGNDNVTRVAAFKVVKGC
jgi:ABC-type multidrug transport system fused ATPase/permease subunit